MKLLLSLSSLVVMLQISGSVAQSEPCVTGHSYFDGCNQCTCLGAIYACTEKACIDTPKLQEEIKNVQKRDVSAKGTEPCVEGHTYQDDCNSCFCTGKGIYACTLRECYHGPQFPDTPVENSEVPTKSKRETSVKVKRETHPEPCAEDHSYSDGCNTCRCVKGGHYACTLMHCFHVSELPGIDEKNPNENHKTHESSVVEDSSAKVKREVETHSEPCVEGQSYEADCNTCRCTDSGVYACTLRACYHGPQFPDTVETHTQTKRQASGCDKGNFYYDGCNNCTCIKDQYACTRRLCPPEPQKIQPLKRSVRAAGCDKGESYFDGCNTCTCIKSKGDYACTRMICPPGPPKVQPAKRFVREIETVTGKYDVPNSKHLNHLRFAAERCSPHEVKNEQCNRCKCTKNGKGWICTRKVCPVEQ